MGLLLTEMRKTRRSRFGEEKFSFEHADFEIHIQVDLSGRHLDRRVWSSGDRNSAFIYAQFRTLQNKTN